MSFQTGFELSRMRYKIHDLGATSVLEAYPELAHIKFFSQREMVDAPLSHERVMRWIIYMFDEGSPTANMNSYGEKKLFCRQMSKVLITTGLKEAWEDMENFNNKKINQMIIGFLSSSLNYYWVDLQVMVASKAQLQEKLLRSPNKADAETIVLMSNSIKQLTETILARQHSLKLEDEMLSILIEENLYIDPIELAEKFKKGEIIHGEYGA
jgi:hypothetical protein